MRTLNNHFGYKSRVELLKVLTDKGVNLTSITLLNWYKRYSMPDLRRMLGVFKALELTDEEKLAWLDSYI